MQRKSTSAIFSNRRFKRTTFQLALAAVFSALVLVATMLLSIPVPATGGYVNVGDTVIFVAGILFGPFVGGVAGGLGSMLADIVYGALFYAPFTLVVKGLEGVLCGFLGYFVAQKLKAKWAQIAVQLATMIFSGLFMVLGYFIVEWSAFGIGAAVTAVTGNVVQCFSSVVLASALLFFCKLGEKVVRKGLPQKSAVKRADKTAPIEPTVLTSEDSNDNAQTQPKPPIER